MNPSQGPSSSSPFTSPGFIPDRFVAPPIHPTSPTPKLDDQRASSAEQGYWQPERVAARMQRLPDKVPDAGLAGMFNYANGENDFRLLRNVSRAVAWLCSGDSVWLGNKLGWLATLGNPRLAHWAYGKVAELEHPRFVAEFLKQTFVTTMGIKPEDLGGRSTKDFPSLQALFLRDMPEGARPIADAPFVSPVDGFLKGYGRIVQGAIPQNIKGRNFSAAEFVGNPADAARFGSWVNLYLSPADYHHVHAPFSGQVESIKYIPGTLWPVNRWSHEHTIDLYPKQERVVVNMNTPDFGKVAVVMVGATTVGGMHLAFDSEVKPPMLSSKRVLEKTYDEPISIRKGEPFGTFKLGSTVVILMEHGRVEMDVPMVALDKEVLKVRYGEPFGRSVSQ